MSAMTEARTPQRSSAPWSKLVASTLSAGALLGMVHLLSATAQRPVEPGTGTRNGGELPAASIVPAASPSAAEVPAAVPAAAPAPGASAAPVAPHAVSRASGG